MQTLAEMILNQILADISAGALGAGARLEEKELAARYNVSRTPVREALRHLAATGMVEFRPRYGVFIAGFSRDRWQEVLEVTADLEAATARYAAARMTAEERAALRAKQEQIGSIIAAGDVQGFDAQNTILHGMIWQGARNQTLLQSIQRLRSSTLPYTRLQFMSEKDQGVASHLEHDAIIRAISASQAELAYHAMRAHVLRAGTLTEDLLPPDPL